MTTKLSDKLAELSVATRKAEDSAAKAQKETSAKIEALRDEAHADAQRRATEFNEKVSAAKGEAVSGLDAWKAKSKANLEALKGKIEQRKHAIVAKSKDLHADRLETDAAYAVDYALCCVEDATSAVLDAIAARGAASEAAKS